MAVDDDEPQDQIVIREYRALAPDEVIEAGDEFFHKAYGWRPCQSSVGAQARYLSTDEGDVRRTLTK